MIALAGFLVNLVGLFAFHQHGHGHTQHKESHGHSHGHSHDEDGTDDNMHSIFLHVAADTLGSLSVLTSSTLIWLYEFKRADPICSLFISLLIGLSVIPLIKHSASILLQKAPDSFERKFESCLRKLQEITGVQECIEPHFWLLTPGNKVGTLSLQVEDDANEQKILADATAIFKKSGIDNITIQINKATMTTNWNSPTHYH